ncbi:MULTISPECIES: alpha-L-glutamate ligase-like protein [unclassified Ectothiorhodospira]|uniref:alpha-L-glutamate ligase-like protein n=1 Tax=unclassified Ectothiorhodospira TaxID=2684909 RepID=UPI001EE8E3F0|nr:MULTISPECIES: alpha-L-glutamate ligase-like protein [unclassified Ectothiorhodospira]MCG5514709.1 alpha-L-glutamate ligase-like protein [Ectothiorhodospira sp. 9100]MCG5518308.1 alpha-L-glutamate ligase-like protein [Ectothiorhodospira sp. 9905]
MTWFVSPRELRRRGVVGMNQRNAGLISELNPRSRYPLVDDKLRTKQLALEAGIAVPELYGVIETNHDIRHLPRIVARSDDFVIKPAHGAGGNGILVITGRMRDSFRKSSGRMVDLEGVGHHVSNVLSGMHSLGGQPDTAMVEYRVKFDPLFEKVSFQGVPDIRTVVYKGYPIMAMVRLPTRDSDGKANLHQGAVGVGINMATGRTGQGVWHNRIVDLHPDTGAPIKNLQIPDWDTLLELAAQCFELTGLGYLGVDVVLDRERGPLMLELNARPGLAVQLANGAGLGERVRVIDALQRERHTPQSRATLAQEHFSQAIQPAA